MQTDDLSGIRTTENRTLILCFNYSAKAAICLLKTTRVHY